MIKVGDYYFEPATDGNGTIWKHTPTGRSFQCDCNPADAARICTALHLNDRLRDKAPQLWADLVSTAKGVAA